MELRPAQRGVFFAQPPRRHRPRLPAEVVSRLEAARAFVRESIATGEGQSCEHDSVQFRARPMNAYLATAAVCLTFPACARQRADVRLPIWQQSASATACRVVAVQTVIINIDSHGKRVVSEQHYDSDAALSRDLRQCVAITPAMKQVAIRQRSARTDFGSKNRHV